MILKGYLMKPNKILIISKPRFGSTTFVKELGNLYQYPSFNEPGDINEMEGHPQFVCKFVVGDLDLWEDTKEDIFSIDWDLIILLRRNEDDAKKSFQQLASAPNWDGWNNRESHKEYIVNPNIYIQDYTHNHYKNGEKIYEEILGMNINPIELTYDRLYNKDKSIREEELNKVLRYKAHWLVKDNVLNELDPKNKYGKLIKKQLL